MRHKMKFTFYTIRFSLVLQGKGWSDKEPRNFKKLRNS